MVVVIQLGAYIHRVLTFCGCLLSRFYGICPSLPQEAPRATVHVQNGNSSSYIDALFELVDHIVLPRKAYYSSQVSRVCVPVV